ncbi:MAG: hypothetical protein WC706_05795 [Sideroxydans sp.]|jgi:hypothetical protein
MSDINKNWIRLSHVDARGTSYVRLQDVERVSIKPVKSENKDDRESFAITVFVQGVEYVYTTKTSDSDANSAAQDVLNKVEIALGRGEA